MHKAGKSSESDENRLAIQQDLQDRLAKNVSAPVLAAEITRLLKLLGKHPGSFERVAQYLAEKLAPRFAHKSEVLQTLIKDRWKELTDWADLAALEEVKAIIEAQKKVRPKIKTQRERLRRNKIAKNRYEHRERNYITKIGAIERDFSSKSALLSLDPAPPTGLCLDEIFHGGRYIGQILDYAQEICRWTFDELDHAITKSEQQAGPSLWHIAQQEFTGMDEASFVDRVSRHLRKGEFLLLIIGDGIRENTENIAAFLQKYAGLSSHWSG